MNWLHCQCLVCRLWSYISASKSTLKTYMTIKVSSRVANEEIEVTVIGGCALLWVSGWPAVGNVGNVPMPHKIDKSRKSATTFAICCHMVVINRF